MISGQSSWALVEVFCLLLLNISRASVQTSGMEQNRQEGGGGLETRRRSLRPKLDPTAVAARLGRDGDLGEWKKRPVRF